MKKALRPKEMTKQIIPGLVSCYTDGENSFYYFKVDGEPLMVRELSSCDNVVRVLSIDDYNDLVYFYRNCDWSAYDPFFLKVESPDITAERIKESQEIISKETGQDSDYRYLYEVPDHLIK